MEVLMDMALCVPPGNLVKATGSRVIGGARPDSDFDFVVYAPALMDLINHLEENGFTQDDGETHGLYHNGDQNFWSYRKGNVNLIVTGKKDFFDAFSLATEMAKNLGLETRAARVALFKKVLYGEGDPE